MLDSNPSLLNDQGILFSMAPPSCRTDTYDAVAGYHRECHTVWYDTDGIDAFVCRWLCQVGYLNRIQDKPISDQILVCPESDVDDQMWVCPESGVDIRLGKAIGTNIIIISTFKVNSRDSHYRTWLPTSPPGFSHLSI